MACRQWDEAEIAFRQALNIAETIGNPTQLWKTHLAVGWLHKERKNPHSAQQAFQAAQKVIERLKGTIQHPALRASLEASPIFRQLYELEPCLLS